MTNLECNVSTCAFFDDNRCKKENIRVVGNDAKVSDETSCASYKKASSTAQNSVEFYQRAGSNTHIECEACRCEYNNNGVCDAASVCVDCCDCSEPGCEKETKCAAFRCEVC